jgi:hypothetical protein
MTEPRQPGRDAERQVGGQKGLGRFRLTVDDDKLAGPDDAFDDLSRIEQRTSVACPDQGVL